MRFSWLLVSVLALFASVFHISSLAASEEMVELKIRLLEKVAGQDEPLVLAQPRIMSVIDRPFSIKVTPSKQSRLDQSEHEVGLKLVAKVNKLGDQRYELKLEWFRGQPMQPKDQPESEYFREEKLHARTVLQPNVPQKITLSSNRWYEVTLSLPAGNPQPQPAKQHLLLTTHIYHQSPGQDKPAWKNSPSMHLVAGKYGQFVSGGKMKSQFDETFHEIGIRMSAIAKKTDDETYLLSLELTQGNLRIQSSVPNTEVLHNDTTKLRTILKSGEKKKIEVSPTSWLELRLEEIAPSDPTPVAGSIPNAGPTRF
ncbi:hypothetical protein [Bremerella volcania]|uniref:hypothetical protein n=1 Tax=Bremerella volcania TaxID=2527984 RepID=UPI00119EB925|nr:hypothetical protein [Bremerella volcania]